MKPEDVPAELVQEAVDEADALVLAPLPIVLARQIIAAVAPLIAAAEREACAQEADYYAKHSTTAKNIAAAIRARGEVK
jgi:hypothetical protein